MNGGRADTLSPRQRDVLRYVARFKMLSSKHIYKFIYEGNVTATPFYRDMLQLKESGYLLPIERQRMSGGRKGGGGQYVWQLGPRAWSGFFTGEPRRFKAIQWHELAIADCVVILKQVERAGLIRIESYSTEMDGRPVIGGYEMKPDLTYEISGMSADQRSRRFVEVDMGTEGHKQLTAKVDAWLRAFKACKKEEWPDYLRVLWVAVDADRARELRYLIAQLSADDQTVFRVCTRETMASLFV